MNHQKNMIGLIGKELFMDKKLSGTLYLIAGVIWLIGAVINAATAFIYYSRNESFGVTYTSLIAVYICLAVLCISLGIKKRKDS